MLVVSMSASDPSIDSMTETSDAKSRWINPFKHRVVEFPDRIFSFESDAQENAIRKLTGDARELIVELGSGSGGHLLELARRNPQATCVGFELRFKRAVRTIEKAVRDGIDSVYVIRADAWRLPEVVGKRSISALHVNFPDPWAKPRQWKHRLLSERFLDLVYELLSEKGALSAKTDHADYYQAFLATVRADSRFKVRAESENLPLEDSIPTEFEGLFRSQGLPIHYLCLERV